MDGSHANERREWDQTVSILRNPLVLREIFKAFGLSFLIFWLILEIISWTMKKSMTLYVVTHPLQTLDEGRFAFGFAAIAVALTALITALIFRNGYRASFGVDENGAWMKPQPGQRKTNRRIHMLLFGLGVITGKPGAAGTALLGEASQNRAVDWRSVHKVVPYPAHNAVVLHDSWHVALILHCRPDNYGAVLRFVQDRVGNRPAH